LEHFFFPQGDLQSCSSVVAELRTPGFGGATLISSHLLLLCLQLWRLSAPHDERDEVAARGGGPALVGNFLQMVELHYRDGWPVARYADALGVTSDKLRPLPARGKTAARARSSTSGWFAKPARGCSSSIFPSSRSATALGFRDPAYFNRFFRKYRGASPGNYRRQIRLEHARSGPSYAAWP
jgi:AraC family transcriptional activator of pobA